MTLPRLVAASYETTVSGRFPPFKAKSQTDAWQDAQVHSLTDDHRQIRMVRRIAFPLGIASRLQPAARQGRKRQQVKASGIDEGPRAARFDP